MSGNERPNHSKWFPRDTGGQSDVELAVSFNVVIIACNQPNQLSIN